MDLLQTRQKPNDILEKRFIGKILTEESQQLNLDQIKLMSSRGFTNPTFFNNRGFQVVGDNKLEYKHPTVLRFIDMKSRTSKNGSKRKKISYTVHNKPLFGMINGVLRRLQFEYTDKMKQLISKEYNIEI